MHYALLREIATTSTQTVATGEDSKHGGQTLTSDNSVHDEKGAFHAIFRSSEKTAEDRSLTAAHQKVLSPEAYEGDQSLTPERVGQKLNSASTRNADVISSLAGGDGEPTTEISIAETVNQINDEGKTSLNFNDDSALSNVQANWAPRDLHTPRSLSIDGLHDALGNEFDALSLPLKSHEGSENIGHHTIDDPHLEKNAVPPLGLTKDIQTSINKENSALSISRDGAEQLDSDPSFTTQKFSNIMEAPKRDLTTKVGQDIEHSFKDRTIFSSERYTSEKSLNLLSQGKASTDISKNGQLEGVFPFENPVRSRHPEISETTRDPSSFVTASYQRSPHESSPQNSQLMIDSDAHSSLTVTTFRSEDEVSTRSLSRLEDIRFTSGELDARYQVVSDAQKTTESSSIGKSIVDVSTRQGEISRQIAIQITQTAVERAGSLVELQLAPEELGILKFRMTLSEAGYHIIIHADRSETQDLLRRHQQELMEQFASMGLEEGSISFDDSSHDAKSDSSHTEQNETVEAERRSSEKQLTVSLEGSLVTQIGVDIRV